MTRARAFSSLVLGLSMLSRTAPSQTPAPQESAPTSDLAPAQGSVVVELVVDDSRGRTITDLKPDEVIVFQDDVRQTVISLAYRTQYGDYELRYVPPSGRVGAVSIRVSRGGSRLRGPDGPQVKPRWVPPIRPFELPLREALEAPEAPTEFTYDLALLRFEARGDTLHHAFVVEIPLKEVTTQTTGARSQAHLSFLLRVKTDAGRTVHEQSLDQPIDFGAGRGRSLSVMRFVWCSHVHLRAGRYLVEMAVMDQKASRRSVRRVPLNVDPWPDGLRVSSLTFLLGRDGLMEGEGAGEDDPFRFEDSALVPLLHPSIAGSEGQLFLLATLYADRKASQPVGAAIELHRDGQLRAKVSLPLPAADSEGRIRYLGGLGVRSLLPGSYSLKLVAQQGPARVEEEATLTVTAPLRVE